MARLVSFRMRTPVSIALRLTVWYVVSAFILIVGATGFLYWFLATNLEQEDIHVLKDNLRNVTLLVRNSSSGFSAPTDNGIIVAPTQPPQSYFRVLDASGRTILETSGMSDELPPPTIADLFALRAEAETSGQVVSRTGKLFQVLSVRVSGEQSARYVQVAMDRRNEQLLLDRYRERFWSVLGLSLVLCSIAGYAIARAGIQPIERIAQSAERIRSTTLHERIGTLGLPPELSGLAETFNNMLDRLQDSFARIAQFSDDVAHELRTPVNNLLGGMEVALGKSRTNEEYQETLSSCVEEGRRISRVIQSLLFLARTENEFEPPHREMIDVGRELAAVQEFYDAAAVERGVTLRFSATSALSAPLDKILFQQAIGNLVSNAIAHTPVGGSVEIALQADASGLKVCVTDTGCGIASKHLPHVFNRFYRVDRARTSSQHNVGLGLAMVKGIVERHGGRVEIDSEVGRGTLVKLIFPALIT